jgi:hypothetical protein
MRAHIAFKTTPSLRASCVPHTEAGRSRHSTVFRKSVRATKGAGGEEGEKRQLEKAPKMGRSGSSSSSSSSSSQQIRPRGGPTRDGGASYV